MREAFWRILSDILARNYKLAYSVEIISRLRWIFVVVRFWKPWLRFITDWRAWSILSINRRRKHTSLNPSWKWNGMGRYVIPARSLVGSKPYQHFFSEKHRTGLCRRANMYLQCMYDNHAVALSWKHDFQLRMQQKPLLARLHSVALGRVTHGNRWTGQRRNTKGMEGKGRRRKKEIRRSRTRCSAIAERPRCRVRYSFRQK